MLWGLDIHIQAAIPQASETMDHHDFDLFASERVSDHMVLPRMRMVTCYLQPATIHWLV